MAIIQGTSGNDLLPLQSLLGVLNATDDSIYGYAGSDLLVGGAGNDTLEGGAGGDILIGGTLGVILNVGTINLSGSDTASYASSNAAVTINLGNMQDLALNAAGINLGVQHVVLGYGGHAEGDRLLGIANLTGSAFVDTLTGDAGANIINGGAGADIMAGGAGNDTFYVDNAGDRVAEASGTTNGLDTVLSSISYTLAAGAAVETLGTTALGGLGAINLTGNEFAQTINGNNGVNVLNGAAGNDTLNGFNGNDILNGGTGADIMTGGTGSDIFYVDNVGDKVIEVIDNPNGFDRIITSVSYTLGIGAAVEYLSTSSESGTAALNLFANDFNTIVTGNNGANILKGFGNMDTLQGLGGNDQLFGGSGIDVLTGGTGNDVFVFDTAPNTITNADIITDFSNVVGDNDTIYLENAVFTALAAGNLGGAFAANATGLATQADDRIIYETDTGKLFYDFNGSAVGGSVLVATLTGQPTLTMSDFLVV